MRAFLRTILTLAQDTVPELIEPNRSLLEKLRQYVTWLGRYPRPQRPNNYMKKDPESGVVEMFPVSQNDWSGYVNLLSVLITYIDRQDAARAIVEVHRGGEA
jgi:hypothetical protein